MVGSILKHAYVLRQATYKNVEPDEKILTSHSFALEEEEMENRPLPFMRLYRSNETAKPHQQPLVEEQSTERDLSNLQAIISQAQSLDEVMKPMPPIPSSKEEKSQPMLVCNQGEFFMEPKKIKQGVAWEVYNR